VKYSAIAAAAFLAFHGAALACVCVGPLSQAEQRETARRIAHQAAAVAEIELVEPMDYEAMRAELYRVVKVHVGRAPGQFRLARNFTRTATGEVQMPMTSCDVVPSAGERTLVVLLGSPNSGIMGIGGTCDHMFINSAGAVDLVRQEAQKLGQNGERG
jgi:hypothetical protein